MIYEWHFEKNEINREKHGVSFEEAQTVFDDPNLVISEDDGPWEEARFRAIGVSQKDRQLFVVYCERGEEKGIEVIRIISARCLTRSEKKRLEKLRR